MERIKQALEKARQERQRLAAANNTSSQQEQVCAEYIVYTQTRIQPISAKVLKKNHIISGRERNAFTDAYKILRTQVLQRLRKNDWNTLAITSPAANEGKTLTAINLAISLAMEIDHTVLLVDADLRHSGVQAKFGLDPEYGLMDYLHSNVPLAEILIHLEGLTNVVLLPGGRPHDNSAEMLSSPKMSSLVYELKTRYPLRIVLFDLPPLLAAADALAFLPCVDATLLVIEDGRTEVAEARRAKELLQDSNMIGTVLNKAHTKTGRNRNRKNDKWHKTRVANNPLLVGRGPTRSG